jgi:hypothetical protein
LCDIFFIHRLVDFGLCSDISQGEVVHMVGSPFWMPPEVTPLFHCLFVFLFFLFLLLLFYFV